LSSLKLQVKARCFCIRRHLKNRILVQDRGGVEFQTAGNPLVVEDLKRGTNPAEKGGRPKDIFEMAYGGYGAGLAE